MLDVKFAKLIMAFAKQDPDVSDVDALAFVKYNSFSVKTIDGKALVSLKDVSDILERLSETPTVSSGIEVGDTVVVLTDNTEVEGTVKDIRYVVDGLGNKYHAAKDVTKK
jgi:hypothetical protein